MYTVHLHISMYNVFLDQFPLSFKRIKVLLVDTGRLLHPIEADTSPFSTKQCLRMVAVNLHHRGRGSSSGKIEQLRYFIYGTYTRQACGE